MKYRIDYLTKDKVYITFLSDRKIKIYNPLDFLVVEGNNVVDQIFQDNTINNSPALKNFSTVEIAYTFSLCFYLNGGNKCFTKFQLTNHLRRLIVRRLISSKFELTDDLPFKYFSHGKYYDLKTTNKARRHYIKDLVNNSLKYCDLEEIVQDLLDYMYKLADNPKYSLYRPKDYLCDAQWAGYFSYRKFNQDT